jgi:hypothetical protein
LLWGYGPIFGRKTKITSDPQCIQWRTVPVGIYTSSISNIANESYFVNGTEPSSTDHPFILQ